MLAIDFGAYSIKAVKIERNRSGYYLSNFGIVLTPPGSIVHGEIKDVDSVSQALGKMLQKKGISDRNCIIALTGQKVIVREITSPFMTEKELKEGIRWEAPKYVPYDLEDSLLDAKIIEELEEKDGSRMIKILLVASPKNLLEQQIAVLKKLKLQPRVADIVANAQMRAFESYLVPSSGLNEEGTLIDIILSIGASTTEITLVEGDRLKFTRTILKGGDDINRLIENKLNVPFPEAELLKRQVGLGLDEEDPVPDPEKNSKEKITEINGMIEPSITSEQADKEPIHIKANTAEDEKEAPLPNEEKIAELVNSGVTEIFNEIRKSLNYFKTQYQKVNYQRIILCGGMTRLSNLGQMLKQFGITVVIANPLKDVVVNESISNVEALEEQKSALATAVGLAKRER